MTSRLTEINVDCADPHGLAAFWCAALGYVVREVVDEDWVEIAASVESDAALLDAVRRGPVPPAIVFGPVPEGKTVKNRYASKCEHAIRCDSTTSSVPAAPRRSGQSACRVSSSESR